MALEPAFIKIEIDFEEYGITMCLLEGNYSATMEIDSMGNGRMIDMWVLVPFTLLMEAFTRATGNKMFLMALVL